MTTPSANLSALVSPVAADVSGAGRATGTPDAGPFQAALVAASQPLTTETVGIVGIDEPTLPEETDELTDANLAGLLAVAAQVLTPPINAAVAQANGVAPQADAPLAVEPTRSRSDALLFDRAAADAIPQPTTSTAQPAVPAAQQPATTLVPTAPTNVPLPASEPTPAEVTARSTTVAAARGPSPTIPAQAPIVVNLTPNVPVPADPSVTNPPVAEPTAAIPATALPSAQLGERPTNAGEQFAAIASAGAHLVAPVGPPASAAFNNVLTEADRASPAPTVALTTEAIPQESVPAARVRFATGETVLPPVNFSTQALTSLGLAPVRSVEVTADMRSVTKPTEMAPDEAPSVAPNPFGGPDRFALAAPAATGAVRAAPAAPAVQVADAVVAHVQVLQRDGAVEFQMRLDPPELGRMQVRLVTRGDEVHGQVLVANDAVRQLIESQMPELRHRLEAAGVTVERFDVATDPGTGGNRNPYRDAEPELAPRLREATIAPRPRAAIGAPGTLDVTV